MKMKIIKPLLTLVISTSTFVNSIPVKRENSLGKSCESEVNKFEDCTLKKVEDIDNTCNNFHTDRCQQFFINRIKDIEGCKNEDPTVLEVAQGFIDMTFSIVTAVCARDENGKACPVSAIRIDLNKKKITSDEYLDKLEEAVKETCKSKQCTDIYLKHEIITDEKKRIQESTMNALQELKDKEQNGDTEKIENTEKNENKNQTEKVNQNEKNKRQTDEEYAKYKEIMDFMQNSEQYMKSAECQSQFSQSTGQVNSSASTLKITSVIIASIGLFLYTLI